MPRIIEILTIKLKPGTRDSFHDLYIRESLPLQERWKVDVVAFGPSLHDADSYYVIRAYPSLEDRQKSQDDFYASEEWRNGPREALLSLMEVYTPVVFHVDDTTLQGLRNTRSL